MFSDVPSFAVLAHFQGYAYILVCCWLALQGKALFLEETLLKH